MQGIITFKGKEKGLEIYLDERSTYPVLREELMEKVWGYEYYGDLRAVDVAICRVRDKVEKDPSNPKYIITRRGVGYLFSTEN